MKLLILLLSLLPISLFGQENSDTQKIWDDGARQINEFNRYVDSLNRAHRWEDEKNEMDRKIHQLSTSSQYPSTGSGNTSSDNLQEILSKLRKLPSPEGYNPNLNNPTGQAGPSASPMDSFLSKLKPLGDFRASTNSNVMPLGLSRGNMEVTDSSKIKTDFKLLAPPEEQRYEKKSQTAFIAIVAIILVVLAIVFIIKQSVNGSKE